MNSKIEYQDKKVNIINDGEGYNSFNLDNLTFDIVLERLGKGYLEIVHGDYSVEIFYKEKGVAFFYMQSSPVKKIFGIKFKAPFEGITEKGIILNKSIMEDVVQLYGEPNWSSCDECNYWASEYNGIQFMVEREKNIPHYPLNQKVHLKRTITEIYISRDLFASNFKNHNY